MSQTLAAATSRSTARRPATAPAPTPRGASRTPRPSLRVVQAPLADHGRTLFVATCLLLLVGGLLALLMLNTAMANGSFRLHDLQDESAQLTDRQQALRQDIAVQAAPARLAARARALGMVPSGSAAFIRLSDGKVLGVAKAAKPAPTPTVKATAPASAATKPSSGNGSDPKSAQAKSPKAPKSQQGQKNSRSR